MALRTKKHQPDDGSQLGVTRRTLQRILEKDLHMFSYKMQTEQQLMPVDRQLYLNYYQAILNLDTEEDDLKLKITMSDETQFDLSGYINKQNICFWGTENLRGMHGDPLHPLKAAVWCRVQAGGVDGPYVFEETIGNTENVTSEHYRFMFNDC